GSIGLDLAGFNHWVLLDDFRNAQVPQGLCRRFYSRLYGWMSPMLSFISASPSIVHAGVRRGSSLFFATRSKPSDFVFTRYCSSPASAGNSRTISYSRPDAAVPSRERAKSTSWPTLNL